MTDATSPAPGRRYRMMIVDDSNFIRHQIQRLTANAQLDIVGTASNGVDALNMFEQLKPDLVTMGITMPRMNGIECIERMVSLHPDVLILVISALADKATAVEAMKKGASGFLSKPFSEAALKTAFAKLLRRLAA